MLVKARNFHLLSYSFVTVGLVLGIAGFVRTSALLVALGTAGIASTHRQKRTIEFYLPMSIAIALFTLAIALPHGR
ncbi:unannotated protein [freshwater metagenome]|uniref:Unannotated protein n=1 Tax=freshwater metagenome TaxID=449393 RepID=A0A6J7XP59_9ZZZZ|nr:hypothetical protein [Actinomycetota bacterium]